MDNRLSNTEYLIVVEDALKNFNCRFIFLNEKCDLSSAGIGSEFEPYILQSLNKNTKYQWRQGDKETEVDFICIDDPRKSFELKTNLSGVFTGGCKGGREKQLKHNPNGSNKYSLVRNDNGKICIYDNVNYLFIALDRPHNGYELFYIKKITCGAIKETDWTANRSLSTHVISKLTTIIDNSGTPERYIRFPWSQQSRKVNYSLKYIIAYLISQTFNEEDLSLYKTLIDEQQENIKKQRVETVVNNALRYISKDELINQLNILKQIA